MEFLNPAALYASFLLPLLLIPYLIKRKPRRLVFSSLLLLKDFTSRAAGSPWGKLRLPPIFFLQLLLLVLLILALGEPASSVRPLRVAIILDNSASMQALEGRKSRFQMAQEEARDLVRGLSARARIDLYLTVPRLAQVGGAPLSPAQASNLISSLLPYDLGEPLAGYGEEVSRLAREKNYERIFLLTDHPVRGESGIVKVISTGRPKDNLAITQFDITRASLVSSQWEARVEVTNFSSKDQTIKLALKGNGKALSSRTLTVAAERNAAASFEGFPSHSSYEAELDVSDGLALDNRRFAVPPALRELTILGISPRPEALYSLRSIPGLSVKVISPEAYQKAADEDHSLEIFHFSSPDRLPQSHAIFILPPKENPLVAVGGPLIRPVISSWREPHPLTRYINFALFRPTYARPVKPLSFGEAVIQSPQGPLAIALEYQGFRYLALGFDPFPYLGRENLPVSIFTLNLLEWLHEGSGGISLATGEPIYLQKQRGGFVVTPKGGKIPIGGGESLFSRTLFQGVYQVVQNEKKGLITINLKDSRESDLAHPLPITLRETERPTEGRQFLFSLWPYLLLLAILLLVLEWFLNPPIHHTALVGHGQDYGGGGRS